MVGWLWWLCGWVVWMTGSGGRVAWVYYWDCGMVELTRWGGWMDGWEGWMLGVSGWVGMDGCMV